MEIRPEWEQYLIKNKSEERQFTKRKIVPLDGSPSITQVDSSEETKEERQFTKIKTVPLN